MNRRIIRTAILSLALSFSRRGECGGLRPLADEAQRAAASRSIDSASTEMEGAWQGNFETGTAVVAGEGHKKLPAYTERPNITLSPSPSPEIGRGEFVGPTIAERRAAIKKHETGAGNFFRAAGYGVAGFVVGGLLGWLAGGVAGYSFVTKAPNPAIQKWKWALVVPAVIAGAVIGAVVMPFLLAYVFSKAKPYPGSGLPDRRNID